MEERNRKRRRLLLTVLLLLFLGTTGLLFISRRLPSSHDPLEDERATWSIRKGEETQEADEEEKEDGKALAGGERTGGTTERGAGAKQGSAFHVSDEDGNEWRVVDGINIFSNEEYEGRAIIAPHSRGVYRFFITNEETKPVCYSIRTKEINAAAIPMVYRLRYNGDDHGGWKSSREISLDRRLLKPGKRDILELEWKWQSSDRDSEIGRNAEKMTYHLYLRLQAEEVDG